MGGVGVSAYLSGGGGRLFEAGRLLTFSAFRMGAYSRWALIRGWALVRINTVINRDLYGDAIVVPIQMSNMANGNQQKHLLPSFATKA